MNTTTQDLLQSYTSQFGEKTVEAVMNLPEEELTWVVYNSNLISGAQMLIIQLRGLEFFDKYVKVVSREEPETPQGKTYHDPGLFNLIGNGYG